MFTLKNCEKSYVDAIVDEIERMENANIDPDQITMSKRVHEISSIKLPGGVPCLWVKSSKIVNHAGGAVAVITYTTGDDGSKLTMITDVLYDRISPLGQEFIQAHEAGHIVAGHLGSADEATEASSDDIDGLVLRTRDIEKEFEADRYAVAQLGKRRTVRAMKEFRRLMMDNPWLEFDCAELDARIKRVRNMAA